MLDFKNLKERLIEAEKENADRAGIYDSVMTEVENDYNKLSEDYEAKNKDYEKQENKIKELNEQIKKLQDTNMSLYTRVSGIDKKEEQEEEKDNDILSIDELLKLI